MVMASDIVTDEVEVDVNRRPLFRSTVERNLLVEKFAALADGAIMDYEQIESLIGYDVRDKRSIMASVVRALRRDHSVLIEAVPNVGYQRCTQVQKVGKVDKRMTRQQRAVQEATKDIRAIDYKSLSETDRRRVDAQMTHASLFSHLLTAKNRAKMLEVVTDNKGALPVAKTLESTLDHFRRKSDK